MHIYAGRDMVLCCLPSQKINKISPKSGAFPSVNFESSGEEKHVCARTHTHTHTHACAPSYENPKTLGTSDVSGGFS